ncbi:MAG: hypothetical protein V4684_07745 [Pseudomonadota bacterium]
MLPQARQKTADSHRNKLMWGGLGALIVAQMIAFWMICSNHVTQAQERLGTATTASSMR